MWDWCVSQSTFGKLSDQNVINKLLWLFKSGHKIQDIFGNEAGSFWDGAVGFQRIWLNHKLKYRKNYYLNKLDNHSSAALWDFTWCLMLPAPLWEIDYKRKEVKMKVKISSKACAFISDLCRDYTFGKHQIHETIVITRNWNSYRVYIKILY